MRLFFIDSQECKHISDIMPGIMATYQMEQEFFPYLFVEFLPYRYSEKSGIILITKDKIIRKNYTFQNKKDINELRNLIWKYIVKDHNIMDITENGCLKDFRKYKPNKIIQNWQERKRITQQNICCKILGGLITSEIMGDETLKDIKYIYYNGAKSSQIPIEHIAYRLNHKDKQNRIICKKLRYQECADNYPPKSEVFNICAREVNWLCDKGYPNKRIELTNQLIKRVKTNVYNYLIKNNFKVDKQKFDDIINIGLFDDIFSKINNRSLTYNNIRTVVDNIISKKNKNQYIKNIEGFRIIKNNNIILFIIIIFIIIIFIIFIKN